MLTATALLGRRRGPRGQRLRRWLRPPRGTGAAAGAGGGSRPWVTNRGTEAKRRPLSPGRGRAPGQPEGKMERKFREANGSRKPRPSAAHAATVWLPGALRPRPASCSGSGKGASVLARTPGPADPTAPSLPRRGTAARACGPHTVAATRGQSRLPVRSEEAQVHTHALADLHAHAHTNSRTCMYTHSRTHAPACAHTHMHSFSAAAMRVRVCRGGRGRPRSVSPVGVCAPTQGPGPRFLTAPHPRRKDVCVRPGPHGPPDAHAVPAPPAIPGGRTDLQRWAEPPPSWSHSEGVWSPVGQ